MAPGGNAGTAYLTCARRGTAALSGTVYVMGGGPQTGLFVSDANESLKIR